MTQTLISSSPSTTSVRRAGSACLVAGVLGAAAALALLLWPEQVSDDRFSYPMTATAYSVTQVVFAIQHVPLVLGVAALLALPTVTASRAARWGARVSVVAMAGLTVMELVAIAARTTATDSSLGSTIGAMYGLPTVLAGVALTTTGVALRRSVGARSLGWPLVVAGLWVFVPMTPVLASGDFVLARLAIGGWMLVFAWLGLALVRVEPA